MSARVPSAKKGDQHTNNATECVECHPELRGTQTLRDRPVQYLCSQHCADCIWCRRNGVTTTGAFYARYGITSSQESYGLEDAPREVECYGFGLPEGRTHFSSQEVYACEVIRRGRFCWACQQDRGFGKLEPGTPLWAPFECQSSTTERNLRAALARRLQGVADPEDSTSANSISLDRPWAGHWYRLMPDVLLPAAKVVIEFDGPEHGRGGEIDARKDALLDELGYRIVRIRVTDLPLLGDSPAHTLVKGHSAEGTDALWAPWQYDFAAEFVLMICPDIRPVDGYLPRVEAVENIKRHFAGGSRRYGERYVAKYEAWLETLTDCVTADQTVRTA